MKLKVYVVDLEISKAAKRKALVVGIPTAMLLMGGVALATVPHTFTNGEVLNASDLNDDLSGLDTRVTAVETKRPTKTVGGVSYSLDAVYCGKTAATTGAVTSGVLSGWPATKALCESACSSPSAHLCTGDELSRSAQLGVHTENGAYGSGDAYYAVSSSTTTLGNFDCMGFTNGTSTAFNANMANYWPFWFGTGNATFPNVPAPVNTCDQMQPLLCCD